MYKVYTEDKDGDTAAKIAAAHFDGFTLTRGVGCWRGVFEQSQCFEVDTEDGARVFEFARALKSALAQSAVLVVEVSSHSVLV
jgi:hypothetical protein